MISNILREARIYEELAGQTIPDGDRPAFQLSPRTGWMNDPNGFSFYQGKRSEERRVGKECRL